MHGTAMKIKLCSFDCVTKWNSYRVHVQFTYHYHSINYRVQYNSWFKMSLTKACIFSMHCPDRWHLAEWGLCLPQSSKGILGMVCAFITCPVVALITVNSMEAKNVPSGSAVSLSLSQQQKLQNNYSRFTVCG